MTTIKLIECIVSIILFVYMALLSVVFISDLSAYRKRYGISREYIAFMTIIVCLWLLYAAVMYYVLSKY